jgi:opacity protein-like surface antigen
LHNSTRVTPYIGLGLGAGTLSGELYYTENGNKLFKTLRNRSTYFAWNVGFGLGIRLSDIVTLDLGYRYADLGKLKASDFNSAGADSYVIKRSRDVTVHEAILGVRLTF